MFAQDKIFACSEDEYIVSAANREAYDYVVMWPRWIDFATVLVGDRCSGKTYLSSIWQQKANAMAITLDNIEYYRDFMHKYENFLIDDAHLLSDFEGEIMHVYNIIKEQKKNLLVTTVKGHVFKLPDLRSRLLAVPNYHIVQPDDYLTAMLIIKAFAEHDIAINPRMLEYVSARVDREYQSIQNLARDVNHLLTIGSYNTVLSAIRDAICA